MPKPKLFLKENKKKLSKHTPKVPETADEYLAAGVEFEEAGEKWRAGDAAKSTRFFLRAIGTYEEALKTFPAVSDLVYNKARVQYELTQHPRLVAQLPGTLTDMLRTALESSRIALSLNQDNTDVLFNTAQVLTSLAEAISDDRSGVGSSEDGLQLLREATDLFQRCLTRQEYQLAEAGAREEAEAVKTRDFVSDSEAATTTLSPLLESEQFGSPVVQEQERWATVIEPVTNDTLLDTVLAQLECLTTLCQLFAEGEEKGLAWVEEYAAGLMNHKIPAYVKGTDREEEAALTKANFMAALAEASFQSRRIDISTYEHALEEAYGKIDLSHDPEGLCNRAEALMAYNSALRLNLLQGAEDESPDIRRWKALTAALDFLTAASQLPSANNVAKIHLARGDIELLRFQLGQSTSMLDIAARNSATLLKNAGAYYRGAESNGRVLKADREVQEAVVKQALVEAIGSSHDKLRGLLAREPHAVDLVLEEAVEDGLVMLDWILEERTYLMGGVQ